MHRGASPSARGGGDGEDDGEVSLRRAVLALAVLDDVDLTPRRDGVMLAHGGFLSWPDIEAALGAWVARPSHPVTRTRLMTLATAARLVADGGPARLAAAVRVHAEPSFSALYPGDDWPVERIGTGPLVAGWGLAGVPGSRWTRPLPCAPSLRVTVRAAVAAGLLPWSARRADIDRLAGLLVHRLTRDAAAGSPTVLRPMAGTDVVTLLLSRRLRSFLAAADGSGMAALAMPTRSRGWSELRRVDPAFVGAAWAATEPLDRGFPTALLVTADEVVLPCGVRDVLGTIGDLLVDLFASDIGRS